MSSSYLIAARRTPIGRFMGGLAELPAPRLGAIAIEAALRDSGVSADDVDEVIMGNVLQAGVGQAPARQAALRAGVPAQVPSMTINKVCGSGLKAVMLADQAIRAGDAQVVVAGGMESMTSAPHLAMGTRKGWKFGTQSLLDAMLHDGLWCATEDVVMGELADQTARSCEVSREEQDQFALLSHQRAVAASQAGKFAAELVPVQVEMGRKRIELSEDEGPRPDTTLEGLAGLRPAFGGQGTATAGNASQISDGAAACVVVSQAIADSCSSAIKARIVASATAGRPPAELFVAPVDAMRMVLRKAEMQVSDIDLFELNEAFASQSIACLRPLEIPSEKVNVHGGAIALGHPIGASGARVLTTLLHALQDRGAQIGLAALCLGGGNAVAVIVERV